MKQVISRRSALRKVTGSAVALAAAATLPGRLPAAEAPAKLKGHVRHSVCKWCYGKIPLDEFCASAKSMGIESVELLSIGHGLELVKEV